MAIAKQTQFGSINVSPSAIATVAGKTVTQCYGVVGLAKKNILGNSVANLLNSDEYHKGVIVKQTKSGYVIDLYVVIAFDVKITELLIEIQKVVKYQLTKTFNIKFSEVNVYVQFLQKV